MARENRAGLFYIITESFFKLLQLNISKHPHVKEVKSFVDSPSLPYFSRPELTRLKEMGFIQFLYLKAGVCITLVWYFRSDNHVNVLVSWCYTVS